MRVESDDRRILQKKQPIHRFIDDNDSVNSNITKKDDILNRNIELREELMLCEREKEDINKHISRVRERGGNTDDAKKIINDLRNRELEVLNRIKELENMLF